jgi:hypothetical protein
MPSRAPWSPSRERILRSDDVHLHVLALDGVYVRDLADTLALARPCRPRRRSAKTRLHSKVVWTF